MISYAAFLGNQPRLSLAELSACLTDFALKRMLKGNVAIFETARALSQEDLDRWGGTVLLARSFGDAAPTLNGVPQLLVSSTQKVKGKVTFALRATGIAPRVIRDLYRTCKDALKKAGRSARYVGNERIPAASALLRDTGLSNGSGGREIVLLADDDFLWIGETIGAQDIDSYTKRDMEKPVRDTRTGLLPPKLAQILLNLGMFLAGKSGEKKAPILRVFDPFCGTGVIPMEALIRRWPVLASDKMEKAVSGCQKNLEWVRKMHLVKKSEVPSTVWKQDATKPFALKDKPDVIVSETTLGPPLTDRATAKEAQSNRSEAEKIEIAFLKNAAASLPGVPLVLTFPAWYLRTGPLFLERIWDAADKAGYAPLLPPGIAPENGRPSILYRRGDQFVGREVVLLKPKA